MHGGVYMRYFLKMEESWEKDSFGRWDINKYIIKIGIKPQGPEFIIPYWDFFAHSRSFSAEYLVMSV